LLACFPAILSGGTFYVEEQVASLHVNTLEGTSSTARGQRRAGHRAGYHRGGYRAVRSDNAYGYSSIDSDDAYGYVSIDSDDAYGYGSIDSDNAYGYGSIDSDDAYGYVSIDSDDALALDGATGAMVWQASCGVAVRAWVSRRVWHPQPARHHASAAQRARRVAWPRVLGGRPHDARHPGARDRHHDA
jgi:hypothetical protein